MFEQLQHLHPRSLAHLVRHVQALVETRLWAKVLAAMALGIAVGIALGPSIGLLEARTAEVIGEWLALPGQLFLAIIQMIVVPLVFASIIRGLAASESIDQLRRLGWRLGGYTVATTTIAVVIGLSLAFLIGPGEFIDSAHLQAAFQAGPPPAIDGQPFAGKSVPDVVTGLIPMNPLGSMVEGEMLQVVIFSIVMGVALLAMPTESSKPLINLLGSLQEVSMTIVRWAMKLAPLAVFGLLAKIASTLGVDALAGMGVYVLTVLLGLSCLIVIYVLIATFAGGRRPWSFLKAVREVQLLGFSTSSSAAVMPLSIRTAEDKLGVRPSIAQLIVPLGATANMDGTALYQAVAAVFLAQVTGVDLSMGALALIVVTTVGASIGAPSAPGVGIVLLSMILANAGIPVEAIALIIGVDRILDMSRTAVNVTGDLTACVVMDRWVGGERTAEQERAEQEARDELRTETGADVIVGSSPKAT